MELFTGLGEDFSDTNSQYYFAVEGQNGNIWHRTNKQFKVSLLDENGTYDTHTGPLSRIIVSQNNDIYPDSSGFVWYSTNMGLYRFNANEAYKTDFAFKTMINGFSTKNDTLTTKPVDPKDGIVLNYSDNEFRFKYAANSYQDSDRTEFRVRLAGFDVDWSAWTSETQKDYTNIKEGTYSFLVQARNVFGTISESEPLHFHILPPWYRTWWAYLLYIIGISSVLYTLHQIRINQILKVQRIRNRLASDLHDEVSATLSSISFFAQALETDKHADKRAHFVKLIGESAGDAKEKITDIVWAINPDHDDWSTFLAKCRRFATDLFESKQIKYNLNIDDNIPGKLNMQVRQHLWLIFKEMITNIARHSEAQQVNVILGYSNGEVKLVVQDDGKGIEQSTIFGNGIHNIQRRAESINAKATLDTDPGSGTRWTINLNL